MPISVSVYPFNIKGLPESITRICVNDRDDVPKKINEAYAKDLQLLK